MRIARFATAALAIALATSCGAESRSGDATTLDGDDPSPIDEVTVFDDGERSIVLVDPVDTGNGNDRRWIVRWDSGERSGEQASAFTEPLARCVAEALAASTDPFLAELRARGLDPGVGADGAERRAVIDAMLSCDGQPELAELAVASLPDFDAGCLTERLTTDQDFVDLYGLQDPDASIDERQPAAERFGPCLDLLANTPETLTTASADCVRKAEAELGAEMMLGAPDFVTRLIDTYESCLTPEEFAQLDLG